MEATVPLSEFCVYTIRDRKTMDKIMKAGGIQKITESKRWVTGEKLFRQAQSRKISMPVLFGDAAQCRDLCYWAILEGIEINETKTTFSFSSLKKIKGKRLTQELILKNSGKPIAPHFIRPYALCITPPFLK